MKLSRIDEAGLLAAIRRNFGGKGRGLDLGIGDDAAVLAAGRRERLILTTDILAEDVDFKRSFHPPFLLGRKSLNVSLSDIAAMGGRPSFALLGLAFPRRVSAAWLEDYFRGFRSAAEEWGVALIGGDLSGAARIVISVTVVGRGVKVVTRRGARPDDILFVSGTLGDAAGGLRLLKEGISPGSDRRSGRLLRAFLDPKPQVALGLELARRSLASAMIDISDGLSVDVHNLCRESRIGAEIWAAHVPLSPDLKKFSRSPLRLALHGGEDFQLLFSVPPRCLAGLRRLSRSFPLTPIGRIVRGRGIVLVGPSGRRAPLPARGWQHF